MSKDLMPVCDFATAALHHYDGSVTVGTPLSVKLSLNAEPAAPEVGGAAFNPLKLG